MPPERCPALRQLAEACVLMDDGGPDLRDLDVVALAKVARGGTPPQTALPEPLPSWVDPDLVRRGQAVFAERGRPLFSAMMVSLMLGSRISRFADVLLHSPGSYCRAPLQTFRRFRDTGAHVLCWLTPESDLFDPTVSGPCDVGVPVSQYDLAIVLLAFSGMAVDYVKNDFGFDEMSRSDIDAYIHLWRYIGWLLGIADRYNPCGSVGRCSELLADFYLASNLDANRRKANGSGDTLYHTILNSFGVFGIGMGPTVTRAIPYVGLSKAGFAHPSMLPAAVRYLEVYLLIGLLGRKNRTKAAALWSLSRKLGLSSATEPTWFVTFLDTFLLAKGLVVEYLTFPLLALVLGRGPRMLLDGDEERRLQAYDRWREKFSNLILEDRETFTPFVSFRRPKTVLKFFLMLDTSVETLPEWVNRDRVIRGQEVFGERPPAFCYGMLINLVLGSRISRFADVLVHSPGGYASDLLQTCRRYKDTVGHVALWMTPGSDLFDPTSTARRSLSRVRAMHSLARDHINSLGRCDVGVPVSQFDMALALLAFSGMAVDVVKNDLGCEGLSSDDIDAYIHLCRLVGYLLGLDDTYNPCSSVEVCSKLVADLHLMLTLDSYNYSKGPSSGSGYELFQVLLHSFGYHLMGLGPILTQALLAVPETKAAFRHPLTAPIEVYKFEMMIMKGFGQTVINHGGPRYIERARNFGTNNVKSPSATSQIVDRLFAMRAALVENLLMPTFAVFFRSMGRITTEPDEEKRILAHERWRRNFKNLVLSHHDDSVEPHVRLSAKTVFLIFFFSDIIMCVIALIAVLASALYLPVFAARFVAY
ncbi:hypothetical protein FOZ60_004257 [Perkinsus olseni]|uniref:ER-bound oxygenase mpaB/mpaB'/Rubber oxygenase catalytic domain-containing protein n=1 Tax=Perkinsus olseni TaxID=32597 RepID=A0A7J6NTI3_PEROL|nr:hypothetical protein FOZ60_004257 [Perkinsus olseni]